MTDGVGHGTEGTLSTEIPEDPHTDDFVVDLNEIGMGDLELTDARPMHVMMATSLVYLANRPSTYSVARLKREREYVERVVAFHVSRSEGTYILLIRSGDEEDGNGRSYQTTQRSGLLEDIVHLVEEKGFELGNVGSGLRDDLPDSIVTAADDEDDEIDPDTDGDIPVI